MRTRALRVVGVTSVVALFVTGCGTSEEAEAEDTPMVVATSAKPTETTDPEDVQAFDDAVTDGRSPAPTPSTSTRPATSPPTGTSEFAPPLPVEPTPLSTRLTDQQLAGAFVNELNKWFSSGMPRMVAWQNPDSPEAVAANQELVEGLADANAPTYTDALLVPDFDSIEHPPAGNYVTTDDLKQLHMEALKRMATGNRSRTGESIGSTTTTYIVDGKVQRTYELVDLQEGKHQRILDIPVELITEPEHPDVPSDIRSLVITFETDGATERVKDMQWG